MIIPELPDFLTQLGGGDYKGLIISLFTLSAGCSRPISGKLADLIGRVPLMIFGTLVCVFCSFCYPFVTTFYGFLLLRFLHGFSTGFKPTAATAFAADIVPIEKRGEAMGIMGVSMSLGASMFPPFGSYLTIHYSIDVMFYVSSLLAFISIAMLLGLKETIPTRKFEIKMLKLSISEIIEKKALPIALVAVFVYLSLGILLTISPDQAKHIGLENKGFLFTSFTVFTILSRVIAGKFSDSYGRIITIKIALILMTLALIFLGQSQSVNQLLAATGALGFSMGIASPAIFAWVIDISPKERLGRFMATVFIALEIGIGGGALFSGYVYGNDPNNFALTYYIAAGLTMIPWFYLQFINRTE